MKKMTTGLWRLPAACAEQTVKHGGKELALLEGEDIELLDGIWACLNHTARMDEFDEDEHENLERLAAQGVVRIGKDKGEGHTVAFTVYGRKSYALSDGVHCFSHAVENAAETLADTLWVNVGQGEDGIFNKEAVYKAALKLLTDNTINLLAKGIK